MTCPLQVKCPSSPGVPQVTPPPTPKPPTGGPPQTPTPPQTPAPPVAGGAKVLYSGKGDGTYYFDVKTKCPLDPNYPETDGIPLCASNTAGPNQQTLRQVGSNNVIAIDANVISPNRAGFCGKKILVFKDGKPVAAPDGGDFFVWDGCGACVNGQRLDFSVSGILNVSPDGCNLGVVPGVSWQVVDTQVRPFVA